MKTSPIHQQLREHIENGSSPEEAATLVLAPFRATADKLCDFAWPAVLKTARDIEGKLSNDTMHASFRGKLNDRGAAQAKLRNTVFRLGNQTVLWDDLTPEALDAKIAWLRASIGTLVDHLKILETARELMSEHKVTRLGDISNWTLLIENQLNPDHANAELVSQ